MRTNGGVTVIEHEYRGGRTFLFQSMDGNRIDVISVPDDCALDVIYALLPRLRAEERDMLLRRVGGDSGRSEE